MTQLTREEIVDIVGEIDDVKAAEIIATGATASQVEEAAALASGVGSLGQPAKCAPTGVVARVYEILIAGEEPDEDID